MNQNIIGQSDGMNISEFQNTSILFSFANTLQVL